MKHVKTFFGVLLLAVALWLVSPVLPNAVLMLLIGAALLVAAVYLRLFDRLAEAPTGKHRFAQGLGLVMAVLGSTQVVGALSGAEDPVRPLKHFARGVDGPAAASAAVPQRTEFKRVRNVAELDAAIASAAATQRPLMLDFYADWCVSCKEMEHLTFADPAVRERMRRGVMLQVDVTANSADDKALLKRFGLFGPPAILFFDGSGREVEAARVIGYQPPKKFEVALTTAGL